MFVYTMSKKKALRVALIVLAVFVGIAIAIAAILNAVSTDAASKKVPIYCVDRADNKIAMTFDCAWENSNTDSLLEILAKENVKATFFVTGEFCGKYPDDVRKIKAAGHEIGNHSNSHPHIEGISINDLIADTREAEKTIETVTGVKPTLYRSPYGEYDNNAITTLSGMNYHFIQWSVDSIDWKEPDPATIVKRVTDKVDSGAILLFHNDLANTEEALPEVITTLKQKGFEFVTVGDLIYTENYHVDSTGKQIYDLNVIGKEKNLNKETIKNITYSDNEIINDAMAIIQANLTFDEIALMKENIGEAVAVKITPLLTAEQILAISNMSDEDYAFAWNSLMTVATPETPTTEGEIVDDETVLGDELEVEEDIVVEEGEPEAEEAAEENVIPEDEITDEDILLSEFEELFSENNSLLEQFNINDVKGVAEEYANKTPKVIVPSENKG